MAGSILVVRSLVEALEESGVSRDALFHRTGFDAARLEAPGGLIELEELDELYEAALDLSGNEGFGLTMGATVAPAFELPSHLVARPPTLRESLAELLRLQRLLGGRPCWEMEEQGETVTLQYAAAPGSTRSTRLRVEAALAEVYRLVRRFDPANHPIRVSFRHAAPEHRARYTRAFDGGECFEQAFDGIVFERRLLDAVEPRRDRGLSASESDDRHGARQDRKTTYSERVREYVLVSAPPDRHNMEAVARGLGLSGRSLRRRLREEGKSYGSIVEGALATVAKRLISDEQRSIEATAYAMGYSDATAFHRAFKRWTGSTPGAFRSSRPPPPDVPRDDREKLQQADLSN